MLNGGELPRGNMTWACDQLAKHLLREGLGQRQQQATKKEQ